MSHAFLFQQLKQKMDRKGYSVKKNKQQNKNIHMQNICSRWNSSYSAVCFHLHLHFIFALSLFNSLLKMVSSQRYTQKQVEAAVELVQSKQMSLNGASKAFGIPYAPLGGKVRSRRPMQPAPKTVLSEDEEKTLVQWLMELSHRGFGRTKDNIKDIVKTIPDARGAKTVARTGCRHFSKDTQR